MDAKENTSIDVRAAAPDKTVPERRAARTESVAAAVPQRVVSVDALRGDQVG